MTDARADFEAATVECSPPEDAFVTNYDTTYLDLLFACPCGVENRVRSRMGAWARLPCGHEYFVSGYASIRFSARRLTVVGQ